MTRVRKMPNYALAQIYMITSPSTEKVYIGSTTLPLERRLKLHQIHSNAKGGCRSREIVAFPDHTIELLEEYPCSTVEELRRREGWYIKENQHRVVNKLVAGRTPSEYYKDNCERRRKTSLEWYYNNLERRKAYDASIRDKRLAYQKNYYATVVKPQKLARRAAAAGISTTNGGGAVAGETPEAVATLNPTSVAAAAPCGV